MAKTIAELEAELEKANRDLGGYRGRSEQMKKELETTAQQLAQANAKVAEFEARDASTQIPVAGAELLGVPGVQAVQTLVQRELAKVIPTLAPDKTRLENVEAVIAQQARQNFTDAIDRYVANVGGEQHFMTRIMAGGDLAAAWGAFLATPRGQMAQQAFASCNIGVAQMALDSFMLEQSRVASDIAPGADGVVAPKAPTAVTDAAFAKQMEMFEARIRAGESPMKVNAEREKFMLTNM